MKKILILTVTAGNGHNACAKGVKEKLEQTEGVEVKIVDIIKEFSSKLAFWTVDSGYNLAVGKLLPLYNMFYEHYKKSKPINRYKCAGQSVPLSTLNGLLKEIYTYKPDAIFCTHFYASIAITDLRLCYDIPCKTIVTNLDYVNSPFWEAGIGVDYFAIPNKDFIAECIEEGFSEKQLLPIGIPANEKFLKQQDKVETRKQLDLDPDVFTVMVMFGGGHWNGGLKIFKNLTKILKDTPCQVIMINGRNKKGYDKIQKMKFPSNVKVINVGFTDKVDYYMSASDIIVNKLGGTSATEIINKELPIVATEKLPAQEYYNLRYLKAKGVVESFKNKKQLKNILHKLINDKQHYNSMVENMKKLKTNAINDLSDIILSQEKPEYDQEYINKIDYSKVKQNIKKALKNAHKNRNK